MRRLVLLVLFGCHAAKDVPLSAPAPTTKATIAPVAIVDASAPTASCAIRETIEIAPKNPSSIENVRVLFDKRTLVTWEDDDEPGMGDSSRSANAAWIDWPNKTFATLPYRAYAAAAFSFLGPTRSNALFTYGIAGAPSFALFDQSDAIWKKIDPNLGVPPTPVKTLVVPMSITEAFAVAESAPIAAVAGEETPCESYYSCEAKYQAASGKGFESSLRVVSLGASPRSEIVWHSGKPLKKRLSLVPAIAFGKTAGAIVFRLEDTIQLATLDGAFHPASPTSVATGDVGAPAIAMKGDAPVIVWAQRASKSDPWQLAIRIDGTTRSIKTGSASAFAPSIAMSKDDIVLAWMEGDGAKHGSIRLAILPADLDVSNAPIVSAAENARDPELSTNGGEEGALVWSEFGKSTRIQARKLSCSR